MKKRWLYIILLIFSLVLFDQVSKFLVSKYLYTSMNLIPNFLNITYLKNYGAAFGILEGKTILLIIISVFVLVYLIYEMKKELKNKINLIAFILVISGIIGNNLIDRLFFGYVRDFIEFEIFGHNFAVFNFADSFMVVGVIILILKMIMEGYYGNNK